jgi:hypothetical protein
VAGVVTVIGLIWSGHDPFLGLNAGFVALAVNGAVTLVSMAILDQGAPVGVTPFEP